jgi:nitrogen fixation/metabolism regulation signal transduction histidine kinase
MIVICEDCGKKYQFDDSKIGDKAVSAKCKACGGVITISKPKPIQAAPMQPISHSEDSSVSASASNENTAESSRALDQSTKIEKLTGARKGRMGLRSKILLLFFVIPVALIVVTGALFVEQLKNLSSIISKDSTKVVTDIAESIINDKAHAVAREVKLYLETHPQLKEDNFANDPEFMAVAVQKVGTSGYTVLNAAPTATDPWRIRAHPKAALIGADIMNAIKTRLSEADFKKFKKLHDSALESGKGSTGYYRFLDDKEKFQAMVPVEGTNFWTISTTYIDEFTQPMKDLQQKAEAITNRTEKIVLMIVGVTALLVALIAFVYGQRLSSKIRKLTSVADRISVGDLDIMIESKDKDELGDLAQAISRMQDSIRLSIERLRRRRERNAA